MKIVKAQSLILVCHIFNENDVSKRIYWYFNSNQIIPHNRFYNESTIFIDTPQNQDTVCTCKIFPRVLISMNYTFFEIFCLILRQKAAAFGDMYPEFFIVRKC